jgi:hypothetical protein
MLTYSFRFTSLTLIRRADVMVVDELDCTPLFCLGCLLLQLNGGQQSASASLSMIVSWISPSTDSSLSSSSSSSSSLTLLLLSSSLCSAASFANRESTSAESAVIRQDPNLFSLNFPCNNIIYLYFTKKYIYTKIN